MTWDLVECTVDPRGHSRDATCRKSETVRTIWSKVDLRDRAVSIPVVCVETFTYTTRYLAWAA